MRIFTSYGFKNFIIAAGYKKEIIRNYYKGSKEFSNLRVVDTGKNTMTGGRILRLKPYFKKNEVFFMTYGDGLCNLNLIKLKKFHDNHGKLATVTAVHPPVRFGELEIKDNQIISFKEKPQTRQGWINGGYFVIEPKFFDLISGDNTVLEQEPLEKVAAMGELMAFQHDGYWQCVDTKRDRDHLEELWQTGDAPWGV